MKNCINCVSRAELQAVVPAQLFTLHALAVNKRTVLATLIFNEELAIFGNYQRVVTRDPRVGNGKILFHLPSDGEGCVVKVERALLVTVDEDQAGKYAGTDTGNWAADDGLSRRHGTMERVQA